LRIAIVNDSALAIEALRRVVVKGGYVVAWIAKDGAQAVAACKQDKPDLVLMDLLMPVMNGVESTRQMMVGSPCPILVVTATVDGNFTLVYDALGAGALDAVNTPVIGRAGNVEGDNELLRKIMMVRRLQGHRYELPATNPPPFVAANKVALPPLVVLGGSTGGPDAVAHILAALVGTDAAVVIVQHIDKEFAGGLAAWLKEKTKFPTELAAKGAAPRAGVAYLAATNDHLVLTPAQQFDYVEEPKELHFRPSVDVFFESVARCWPRKSIAAVLTGMGRDGAAGIKLLKQKQWTTLAQDQKSSVVFGMPKAAIETGAITETLHIRDMGPRIVELLSVEMTSLMRSRAP
jgi:two-component system, chemotaxis family, response regulator WspF